MKSKVYGVGINDYTGRIWIDGKTINSYQVWINMLMRCYDYKFQNRNTTYIGTTVCDEWLYSSKFKKWF